VLTSYTITPSSRNPTLRHRRAQEDVFSSAGSTISAIATRLNLQACNQPARSQLICTPVSYLRSSERLKPLHTQLFDFVVVVLAVEDVPLLRAFEMIVRF
jgi:hypothetical protein